MSDGIATVQGGYHGDMAATLVQGPSEYLLTVKDRCDRCGAQAYVSVTHHDWESELLFCGHHGKIHIPALIDLDGIWVHDESERLYGEAALMKTATTEV